VLADIRRVLDERERQERRGELNTASTEDAATFSLKKEDTAFESEAQIAQAHSLDPELVLPEATLSPSESLTELNPAVPSSAAAAESQENGHMQLPATGEDRDAVAAFKTPTTSQILEAVTPSVPRPNPFPPLQTPHALHIPVPPGALGHDAPTPTPGGGTGLLA
jgi:hypothetical protein